MINYYNFQKNNQFISYEPYLYDKTNNYIHILLGITMIIVGISLSYFNVWNEGKPLGLLFGGIMTVIGLNKLLFESRTIIELNKFDDALYKINPFRKKKITALSNIYNVITVGENGSYTFHFTKKDNASAKSIVISTFIDKSSFLKPEIVYLENEIIPTIIDFLQINSNASV